MNPSDQMVKVSLFNSSVTTILIDFSINKILEFFNLWLMVFIIFLFISLQRDILVFWFSFCASLVFSLKTETFYKTRFNFFCETKIQHLFTLLPLIHKENKFH